MFCGVDGLAVEQQFVRKPASDVQVMSGGSVTLECAAEGGKRAPRLRWRRHSGVALPHNRHTIILGMTLHHTLLCLVVKFLVTLA